MRITENKSTETSYNFSVEIPFSKIKEYQDFFIAQKAKTFKKDGYRPGKVPLEIVRAIFIDEATQWAREKSANESWDKVRADFAQYKFSGHIDVKPNWAEDEKDSSLAITCEKWPELNIEDAEKLKIDAIALELDAKDAEAWSKTLAEEIPFYKSADKKHKVDGSETVTLSLLFTHKGKEVKNSRVKEFKLDLTDHHNPVFARPYGQQLAKNLPGLKAGEEIDFNFKANKKFCWNDRRLANERIDVKAKVLDIEIQDKEPTLEMVAKRFDVKEADLTTHTQEMFKQYGRILELLRNKRVIFDHLNEVYPFDIYEKRWQSEAKNIEHMTQAGSDKKMDKDEIETLAKRRVRLGIILQQLGDKCGQADEQDIEDALNIYAVERNVNPVLVRMWFNAIVRSQRVSEENAQAWQTILAGVNEIHLVNYIMGKSELKEKKISWSECKKKWEDIVPTHLLDDAYARSCMIPLYESFKASQPQKTAEAEEKETKKKAAPKKKAAAS